MSTVPRQRTGAGPAHAATGERPGWGPTPRSRRSYAARRDSPTLTILRTTAYILTSLASVAFLLLAGFAAVQYLRFPDALWPVGTVGAEVGTAHGCAAGPPPACAPSTPTLRPIDLGSP